MRVAVNIFNVGYSDTTVVDKIPLTIRRDECRQGRLIFCLVELPSKQRLNHKGRPILFPTLIAKQPFQHETSVNSRKDQHELKV